MTSPGVANPHAYPLQTDGHPQKTAGARDNRIGGNSETDRLAAPRWSWSQPQASPWLGSGRAVRSLPATSAPFSAAGLFFAPLVELPAVCPLIAISGHWAHRDSTRPSLGRQCQQVSTPSRVRVKELLTEKSPAGAGPSWQKRKAVRLAHALQRLPSPMGAQEGETRVSESLRAILAL